MYDEETPSKPLVEKFTSNIITGKIIEKKPKPLTGLQNVLNPSPRQNFNKNRLEDALSWAFSEPHPSYLRRTRAVVVMYKGQIIAERYAPGITKHTSLLGWSMTKSVMNALVGILIKEGRLALDDPVPVDEWQNPGDPREEITLRHLLHMTSGLEFNEEPTNILNDVNVMLLGTPNMSAFAAKKNLAIPVGSAWRYSSGTTNILAGILRKIVGETEYVHFPSRHLFEPLGMNSAVMEIDASGTWVGATFMYASARDWGKLGQLFLQDGVWNGHRILSEGWVEFSTTPVPQSPHGQFGAHLWLQIPKEFQGGKFSATLPPDTFHAVGHEGQFISIIPSRELVVVRLGLTRYAETWNQVEFLKMVLNAFHS